MSEDAATPESTHQDLVARDAAEEEAAMSRPPVAPDATAAYGEHPDQVVDFYIPRTATAESSAPAPGAAPAPASAAVPVVALLHGGAWRAPYDRGHCSPLAGFLARRGFAVANIEYRKGGSEPGEAGRWPDTFDDVAAALDALPGLIRAHLPQADAGRVVLTGHSAGGHLALWAVGRHRLPEDAPWRTDGPPPVRGVVALAPCADFETADKLDVCSGAHRQLLGGDAHYEERRPYADPALLLPTDIPTTLVHGRNDVVVPQSVTETYAEAAARAGEVVGVTLLEDVGHFPLIDPSTDACAVVAEEIAQLAW